MNQKHNEFAEIGSEINIGKIYQHYSGKLYNIVALARDSESPEVLHVVYQGLYECNAFGPCPIWVRPYTSFIEEIIFDGLKRPRFIEIV